MKRKLLCCSLQTAAVGLTFFVLCPQAAHADFSGYYAPANWTLTNTNADGFVLTSNAPSSITLVGGANDSGNPGTTDFTITAPAAGNVSFNFAFSDPDLPLFDTAGYLLNGTYFQIALVDGESGPVLFPVMQGDVFGFRVDTLDNTEAPGQLTISSFSAPVPEPSAWAMMALGGASILAVLRARKKH